MADLAPHSVLWHLAGEDVVSFAADGLALREASIGVVLIFDAGDARPYGVDAPTTPNTAISARNTCAWIAPGQWLVMGEDLEPGIGIDMSDAYCAIAVGGARAGALLSKSVPIDLDALGANACARTLMGSLPVFLLARGDGFLLLVERGLGHAAWSWLTDGAAALTP